ncbi:MAG: phosphate ABC transporter permease PstA [Roseburia sp.]|nr:phosphate ABC transporter permease PstA [Roseburia sp.]MCM1098373.1 phosphate ABC transporter permease PstA [Ruminococcus flavefaciens]
MRNLPGKKLCRRRVRLTEVFARGVIYGAASLSALFLAGILGTVFRKGASALKPSFLAEASDLLRGTTGVGGNLVNTGYILLLTLAFAVPAGTGGAIWLSEYARPGRLVQTVEFAVDILAGIPSILFGLFGYVFFGSLGLGYSLLRGSLTLSMMVLPLILRSTGEALREVPESYRQGALALGAGKWDMIRTVLLPAAAPGILTGVILAAGRILGESAALLLTAGSAGGLPEAGDGFFVFLKGLGNKLFQSGGTLTVALYLQMQNGRYEAAFGIGCLLILISGMLEAGKGMLSHVWRKAGTGGRE